MPLQRLHDWPVRLDRILSTARYVTFEWGQFDCALFVCACIKAMTGADPGAPYLRTYANEAGAIAIYGGDLAAFAATKAAALGMPEVPVPYARRGDVVFVDNGTLHGALGIIGLDGRFALCASDTGMVMVRIDRWKRCWQVG